MADNRVHIKNWGIKADVYELAQLIVPDAPILNAEKNERVSTLLFGNIVKVYQKFKNWVLIANMHDGYIGYAHADNFIYIKTTPSQINISVKMALVFKKPDIKSEVLMHLPLNAEIEYEERIDNFVKLSKNRGYIHKSHIEHQTQPIEKWAEYYLHTPYLWGGASTIGIDCSGLTQQAYRAMHINIPRDSDQQEASSQAINLSEARPGDLLFWQGHVAMVYSDRHIIHATAYYMKTVIETTEEAIKRIGTPQKIGRIIIEN